MYFHFFFSCSISLFNYYDNKEELLGTLKGIGYNSKLSISFKYMFMQLVASTLGAL